MMEEENMTLHVLHTSSTKCQLVIASEDETLRETMVVVYEEMTKFHHTVAPTWPFKLTQKIR